MSFQEWWKCFGESWSVSSLIFPWLACGSLYSWSLGFSPDSFELKDVIALRWCFSWMTSPSDSLVCQGSIWLPEAKESSASGQTEWRTYWNSKMWECRNWWWNHLSIAWVVFSSPACGLYQWSMTVWSLMNFFSVISNDLMAVLKVTSSMKFKNVRV